MSATSVTENQTIARPNTSPHTETSSQGLFWYRATIGLVGITFILLIAYLVLALGWRSRPFMGLFTTHSMIVNAGLPASGQAWAGLDAGLQQGDLIHAIDNTSLASNALDFQSSQQSLTNALSTYQVGDVVAVTVQRSGASANMTVEQCGDIVNGVAQCVFDVELQQIPDGDYFTFFGMPFVTGFIIFSIGASIIYLRRNQSIAIMATTICMVTAIHTLGIFDLGTTWMLIPVWLVATSLIGGFFITFGLHFPTKLTITQTQPVINYVPLTVSLVIAATALFAYFNPEVPQGATLSIQVASFFLIGSTVIFAAQIIGIQRPRALTLAKRDQTNALIIGITLVIIPAGLYILSRLVSVINPQAALGISIEATLPFYITSSLSIAYAVLQYRQFNTDRIVSRSITYGIMLSVLIIGYFLFVTGLTFATQGAIQADNPILIALTMFGMVMFFSPLRNLLQSRIDSIYYRTRHNYQQSIEQFSQKLTSLVNFDEIIGEFETVLEESITPNNIFIFLPRYETGDYEAYSSGKAPTDIRFGSTSGVVKLLSEADNLIIIKKDNPLPKDLRKSVV